QRVASLRDSFNSIGNWIIKMNGLPSWFRRRWTRIAIAAALVLAVAYVGSYGYLSRRGMREAKAMGMNGFLYIPVQHAIDEEDLSSHYTLAWFYAPANAVDRSLTGADGPVRCMLFHLSK